MSRSHITKLTAAFTVGIALVALAGCDKKADAPAPAKPAPATPAAPAAAPAAPAAPATPAASNTPAKPKSGSDDHDDGHHHGPTTQLGEQSVNGFTIKASRDGDITPGGDAPIDALVTGGGAKVSVVRFWVGTKDAKGSVKAKAALEGAQWHTHAEIPNPLPPGSQLWVEIETEKGEKIAAGFDLKN